MGLLDRAGGFMDEIRCDESEYLIWKWHPRGSRKGSNARENAIRWGSSLRVRDGSVAAFVYNKKDGSYQDFIEGPCDQILKTVNLPVLASIVGMAYDGSTPFQAEVYFINLAQVVQLRFGVPYFDVFDPRFPDFGVPFAVRGTLTFHIRDYRQFIQLHRLDEFDLETFKQQVKDAIVRYVKGAVANAPAELNIPVIQLERALAKIHDQIEPQVGSRLVEKFGVEVSGFDISAIEPDKASGGYRQLMVVTRDVETQTVQAQTEARVKDIHDQQRIDVENLEESLRIQREEAQRAQRMATETTNIGAFQLEKQAEVGVAGANALGQMGANGATEIGSPGGGGADGGSGWFDPVAMMAGMTVGGAVGQNIAGMMNGMMGGLGGQMLTMGAPVPPPVPRSLYYVAVNGAATGPFDMAVLKQMVAAGEFTRDSLVWKPGMAEWQASGACFELGTLFAEGVSVSGMPPVPKHG